MSLVFKLNVERESIPPSIYPVSFLYFAVCFPVRYCLGANTGASGCVGGETAFVAMNCCFFPASCPAHKRPKTKGLFSLPSHFSSPSSLGPFNYVGPGGLIQPPPFLLLSTLFPPSLPPKPTTKGRGGISRLFLPPSSRPESFLLGACGNFPKVLFLPLLPLSVSSSFQITKEEGEEEGEVKRKGKSYCWTLLRHPPTDRTGKKSERGGEGFPPLFSMRQVTAAGLRVTWGREKEEGKCFLLCSFPFFRFSSFLP